VRRLDYSYRGIEFCVNQIPYELEPGDPTWIWHAEDGETGLDALFHTSEEAAGAARNWIDQGLAVKVR
jgi:hypothetical protein